MLRSSFSGPLFLLALFVFGCAARDEREPANYEEYRASLPREAGEHGVWLADGDLAIDSEKRLRELYARGGLSDLGVWGPTGRRALTYCVSASFGASHAEVVSALDAAAAPFEAAADVDFVYVPAADARCDASSAGVLFDVSPTHDAATAARAFFPSASRAHRRLLLDLDAHDALGVSLTKTLEHQLGHILGLDHARVGTAITCDAPGTCAVDAAEIPHDDLAEVRALYGAPRATAHATPAGESHAYVLDALVTAGSARAHDALAVVPGSRLAVTLSGGADLDLYVRFDDAPTAAAFDCRPYGPLADERCELEVPAHARLAFVTVRSEVEASESALRLTDYALALEYVAPVRPQLALRTAPPLER